jgi:hypothetical protein
MNRPALTDTQILLLLDNCIATVQKLQEREREAGLQGHHSRVEYVRKLRMHYTAMQEALQHEIFRNGLTPSELARRLADIDRRTEQPPVDGMLGRDQRSSDASKTQ